MLASAKHWNKLATERELEINRLKAENASLESSIRRANMENAELLNANVKLRAEVINLREQARSSRVRPKQGDL